MMLRQLSASHRVDLTKISLPIVVQLQAFTARGFRAIVFHLTALVPRSCRTESIIVTQLLDRMEAKRRT